MSFKHCKTKPGCLSADGRLFHIFGPYKVEKLLPEPVFVRGTQVLMSSAERIDDGQ